MCTRKPGSRHQSALLEKERGKTGRTATKEPKSRERQPPRNKNIEQENFLLQDGKKAKSTIPGLLQIRPPRQSRSRNAGQCPHLEGWGGGGGGGTEGVRLLLLWFGPSTSSDSWGEGTDDETRDPRGCVPEKTRKVNTNPHVLQTNKHLKIAPVH